MKVLCIYEHDWLDPFERSLTRLEAAKMIHVEWLDFDTLVAEFYRVMDKDKELWGRVRNYVPPVNVRLVRYLPEPRKFDA